MSNEYPRPKRPNGLALLCFDAGGARVISQLTMLGDIMQRWKTKVQPNATHDIPPCEAFDAICGVGIGGLAAILLVVFGMTARKALETIQSVGEVFTGKKQNVATRSNMLREWTIRLLEENGTSLDAKLLGSSKRLGGCRLMVPIISKENVGALPSLRNYHHSKEPPLDVTIVEAILTTCADPELFNPVSIHRNGVNQQYLSGATILPNPIRKFIAEMHECFGGDARVASLISLGSGHDGVIVAPSGANASQTEFLERVVADAESIAQEMLAQIGHLALYLRLSVEQGMQIISIDAWRQAEQIISCTRAYLDDGDVEAKLEAGIDSLVVQNATATLDHLRRSGGHAVPSPSIPAINSYYVDRPGPMSELVDRMQSSSTEQKIVVVSGLGGCGKTTLVLKYIKNRRPQYKPVFFVDGGSRDTSAQGNSSIEETHTRIQASITQHVRSLGTDHSQKTFEDAMTYLCQPINGERLIVLDNIDDPELDLDPYIPDCPSVSIIITTRDPDRGQLASHEPIALDVMSSEEAVELLFRVSKRTRNAEEEAGALSVAETLGLHPIALVQAGSYIAQTKITWENYVRVYEESRKDMMDRRVRNQRGMRYSSAYAAFDASYKALSFQAQQLLHLFSFFHRVNLPLKVIQKAAESAFKHQFHRYLENGEQYRRGKKLLEKMFHSRGAWSEVYMNSLITTLQNYSFISITETPYTRLVHLHSLIHTWAHDRVDDEAHASYTDASFRLLSCGSEFEAGPVNQSLAIHVVHLAPLWDNLNVNDKASFASILVRAGMYEPSRQLAEAVLNLVKQESPTALEEIAFATNELSNALHQLGRYTEALTLIEETLRQERDALGDENPGTIRSMSNVAATYYEMGRYTEALALKEEVLRLRKKVHGDKHLKTITAMENLATTYYSTKRLEEALKLEEEVLRLRQELLGKEDLQTILASENLASTYHKLGRYSEALSMREEVLKLRTELLGKEHPDTLYTMRNLAGTYRKLDRLSDALELGEEALRLSKKVLGEQHPNTVYASSYLAVTYHGLGRFQEALTLRKDVLKQRREVLGSEHPHTIEAMRNLAKTCKKLKHYEEADSLEEEARKMKAAREERTEI